MSTNRRFEQEHIAVLSQDTYVMFPVSIGATVDYSTHCHRSAANIETNTLRTIYFKAGPSGRAVQGVGRRPLVCWDCGFASRRRHRCLSVVSVVCCRVAVSATGRSLVQRGPTDCGASCVMKDPHRGLSPLGLSSHKASLNTVRGSTWLCYALLCMYINTIGTDEH